MSRKGSSTSRIQRSLEEQSCRSPSREKLQRLWCYQRRVDWIRVEHFPGFTTLQLCDKVSDLLSFLGTNTRIFHRKNSIYVNVQWHLLWQKRQQRWTFIECQLCEDTCEKIWYWAMVIYWTRFWEKWYSSENSPQGAWDKNAEEMLLEFAESGHPLFRATTPLSRGQLKSKGRVKLSTHFAADDFTIETIYRIMLSVNKLSVYGAVAAICEEFEDHQDRSGEPEIMMGQSIILGEVQAETPLQKEKSHERPNYMAAVHSTSWIAFTRKQSK